MLKKNIISVILLLLFVSLNFAQTSKHAITIDDLWKLKRIGSVDISADGKFLAFEVTTFNMETNKGNTDIFICDSTGANLTRLNTEHNLKIEPVFLPLSKRISYIADDQLWVCDYNGQNLQKITDLYSGVSGVEWSFDEKKIIFVSSVYPECETQDCIKERDEQGSKSLVKAKIFTELMYRHWNNWRGEKRSHLFHYNLDTKQYTDLTPQSTFDVPPIALGGDRDYSFSPDGKEVVFAMNKDEMLATSTNNDIFIVKLDDKEFNHHKLSVSLGNDNQPGYSPDGKYITFKSMQRAGFEADKQDLMLFDRKGKKLINVTSKLDISIGETIWSGDSRYIYYTADKEVNKNIYRYDTENNRHETVVEGKSNSNVIVSASGLNLYFKQMKSTMPYEVFNINLNDKKIKQLTFINKDITENIEWNDIETFWSKGEDGANVQSILVKPPFFDPNKKYPMVFLIHGGPQGAWTDDFHYRWNTQMFASKGYVVVAVNPRGSTGYGQKFCDEISGDWGGKPYTDLMNAYDYAVNNYKFIDKNNTFAAGASYGGYMINWLEGHETRFNAVVSHAGVFNLESMYGSTEELWFPEWEYKGTPWTNREMYVKWSPHQYAKNFKTPMLVVHGAFDFRVPESQAFELFTTLQRLGVKSKFLYFPDETHFVAKPQNAKLWWTTIYEWFEENKR
ncbi:MAG TPA: S9 family peptidase [Melioribacteraceae bacterium]|nr:S9 family peptidase [Melioribacteraceae bacterium]